MSKKSEKNKTTAKTTNKPSGKYPRGLINFYDEEKMTEKKNTASNIVEEDELDFRKREKMHDLLKAFNKVSGDTIGISGEQGSGKTTVVKETLLNSFI